MSTGGDRPIRVLLVDDHAVVRKVLRALLDHEAGIEVAGEAADGEQAVRAAERLRPDVILMDLEMPGTGGIEATRRITEARPDTRVVVPTSHSSEEDVFPALKAGALGYLLKHSAPEEVLQAIRQAYRGETVLHPRSPGWSSRSCTVRRLPSRQQPPIHCRIGKSSVATHRARHEQPGDCGHAVCRRSHRA
jgi:DNA-binding NarL/FixJ family response regulator